MIGRRYPVGRRLRLHCHNGVVIEGEIAEEVRGWFILKDGARVVVEECDEELQFDSAMPDGVISQARKNMARREPFLPVDAVDYMEIVK